VSALREAGDRIDQAHGVGVAPYDVAGHAAALLAAAKTIRLLYDALLAQEDRLAAVEARLDRIEDRIGDTIGMGE